MISFSLSSRCWRNCIIWSFCILLFASGCSKTPGDNDINSKDVPLKYALIGDTLFPVQHSYEVHEIKEDRTVSISLKKDFDEGSVEYSYHCSEVNSKKDLDLKNAEKRFKEFYDTINSNDGVYLKKIVGKYTRFKAREAFISKTQLRYSQKYFWQPGRRWMMRCKPSQRQWNISA